MGTLVAGCAGAPPEARPTATLAAPTATSTPKADPLAAPFTVEAPADPSTVGSASGAAITATGATTTRGTALDVLATIPIKGRAPLTGYDRNAQFGNGWLDVDRNGCDTRNDMLALDLTDVVKSGPCKVLSGTLVSPFTAETVDFVRGNTTSTLVQIDHVVSLSNAWQTGAQQLTLEQRISFSNDPLNLLAVDGASNQQKGAGDAATWLPKNKAFRCEYVAIQVSVKAAYALWVTRPEHDAIARILAACPGQPAVASAFAPAVTVATEPEPVPARPADDADSGAPAFVDLPAAPAAPPAPAVPADAYYANCDAARAAGAAPLYVGEPGYRSKLDGDSDGVACEPKR